jgi:hypothetical protein
VLATLLHEGAPDSTADTFSTEDEELGLHLWLRRNS